MNANFLVEKLQLEPHPEGGYYRETYRSPQTIVLPGAESRNLSTAIYYLLENSDKSHLHRIKSDEFWFFHQGQPLEIVSIKKGKFSLTVLGNDMDNGEIPQLMIEANDWFGARVKNASGYSLVSCTVAPGFDFSDFELGKRDVLIKEFPELEEMILEFTR